MSRLFAVVAVVAIVVARALSASSEQSANDLFQKALSKERVEGRVDEAVQIYERIVKEFASDRTLAAKALLQIGRAYERLGRSDAKQVYSRLLRQYADQRAVVEEATTRLAALVQRTDGPPAASTLPRARQLWQGQSAGQFLGSPSPDGRFISFVDWTTLDLALWDVASGAQRPLTREGAKAGGAPYWSRISPDGATVAFTFFNDTGAGDLRLVRLDDPTVRVLYRNDEIAWVQPFDWSPDGKRLLVLLAMPDRSHRIAIMTIADGSVRVLKTLDWRQPQAMGFSPDGRWIVYDLPQDDTATERDVFLLAVDATRETRLVQHPADDFLLGWAPDGKTVLFASDRTGTSAAWAIDAVDGRSAGSPRFVRGDLGWRIHPMGFSRSGAFFYFVENTVSDMYTAALDPRPDDNMTPVGGRYSGTYQSADWSPDGSQLALVVDRAGLPDRRLVVHNVAGGEARELRPDLQMFTWPRWSPDGRSILVSGRERRKGQGYFQIDALTGSLRALLHEEPGTSLHLRAEWAPDGHSILYVRRDSTGVCVVKRDLASGRDTEIDRMTPRGTLVLIAPSPDGRWIAVSTRDDRRISLKVIPAAGGDGVVVAEGETLKWFNFVTWTPDSREVLFGRQGAAENVEVWRVPATGGEARRTGLVLDTLRDLRVHPDGRRVVFASGQNKGELWVMENFLPIQPARPPSAGRR